MDRDVHYFDHDKFFFFLEVSPGLLSDATTFVSRSMINHEDTFGNCYATTIDGSFPPAWVGIGNAYAAQGEGDQAMAAFRSGARFFSLLHLGSYLEFESYLKPDAGVICHHYILEWNTCKHTITNLQNSSGSLLMDRRCVTPWELLSAL
ncbi:hypothetical protein B296_00018509 [Ensete ventricosum]|uniref:Uncharacterized protein n=1 Tax=Ensete ventricosum TaxID=4639 RepID=A0A426ZU24_ENSVE|nr:hypothetical protein B296_00018509 [Ensete ventricosum]